MKGAYICKFDGRESLPEDLLKIHQIDTKGIHTDLNEMSKYARYLKEYRQDGFTRLPFCVTLEAEALGATIVFELGDKQIEYGPRIKAHTIESAEDLHVFLCQDKLGLSTRQKTVLACIEKDAQNGVVALGITGPLTVCSGLMDQGIFYKVLRREPDLIHSFLDKVTDHIIAFASHGIDAGASIISFADPVGAMEIIGPKHYKNICLPYVKKILQALISLDFGGVVHICPKTSMGLSQMGVVKSTRLSYGAQNYSYGLLKHLKMRRTSMIGYRCIKDRSLEINRSNKEDVEVRLLEFL